MRSDRMLEDDELQEKAKPTPNENLLLGQKIALDQRHSPSRFEDETPVKAVQEREIILNTQPSRESPSPSPTVPNISSLNSKDNDQIERPRGGHENNDADNDNIVNVSEIRMDESASNLDRSNDIERQFSALTTDNMHNDVMASIVNCNDVRRIVETSLSLELYQNSRAVSPMSEVNEDDASTLESTQNLPHCSATFGPKPDTFTEKCKLNL